MARTKQTAAKSTGGKKPKKGNFNLFKKKGTKDNANNNAKRKWRRGTQALREIRKYQKSTDLLIQKVPFARLVREVIQDMAPGYRVTSDCLTALQVRLYTIQTACDSSSNSHTPRAQEGIEAYMVGLFTDAMVATVHGKRVTLTTQDIQVARRLRGERE
jgi:histone H3